MKIKNSVTGNRMGNYLRHGIGCNLCEFIDKPN